MASNKHRTNQPIPISTDYLQKELGGFLLCPKRNCNGSLVEVFVRYEKGQEARREMECSTCGKVVRPRSTKDRRSNVY